MNVKIGRYIGNIIALYKIGRYMNGMIGWYGT